MDLQEVCKIIRESPHTDYINNITYDFSLPHLDILISFVGIVNIYKFFYEQDSLWKVKLVDISDNQFSNSVTFFSAANTFIQKYINEVLTNIDYNESELEYHFKNYLSAYFKPNSYVFLSDSAEVEFLIRLLGSDKEKFQGSYKFFTNQSLEYSSRKSVEGYIAAYEFANRESSVLFNRRESEKRYVNDIRNKLLNIESDYQNGVLNLVKRVEEDYNKNTAIQDQNQNKSRELLAGWLQSNRTRFTDFFDDTNSQFYQLYNNSDAEVKSLLNNSTKEIKIIQKQYRDLLRLKEPVTYWKDRAIELNKKANNILFLIISISLVFAILVYCLLWFTPEGLLDSIFGGSTSRAIRWSFIFIIFVSIFFVVIKALMKYMFSNYHLARDAEEREKLTYLYISLRNDSNVSEEEKKIVFQALFSRSDTGLLKEDSSPTMPSVASIIEKIK